MATLPPGDSRSNEQPGLTAYHTVWLREHNRLAEQLAALNPHWADERLYQEARKILIAEMTVKQVSASPVSHPCLCPAHTYNEWLPIVLGTGYMQQLDILPVAAGYSDKYDPSVNPTIINSFAAAAFRFGHTLIEGMLE